LSTIEKVTFLLRTNAAKHDIAAALNASESLLDTALAELGTRKPEVLLGRAEKLFLDMANNILFKDARDSLGIDHAIATRAAKVVYPELEQFQRQRGREVLQFLKGSAVSDVQRRVFELYVVDGLTVRAIRAETGISTAQYARAKLIENIPSLEKVFPPANLSKYRSLRIKPEEVKTIQTEFVLAQLDSYLQTQATFGIPGVIRNAARKCEEPLKSAAQIVSGLSTLNGDLAASAIPKFLHPALRWSFATFHSFHGKPESATAKFETLVGKTFEILDQAGIPHERLLSHTQRIFIPRHLQDNGSNSPEVDVHGLTVTLKRFGIVPASGAPASDLVALRTHLHNPPLASQVDIATWAARRGFEGDSVRRRRWVEKAVQVFEAAMTGRVGNISYLTT